MRPTTVCLAMLLTACTAGGDDTADTDTDTDTVAQGSGMGRLLLRFRIKTTVLETMPEDEPAIGPFQGNVFYADQVSAIGPEEGAEVLDTISVASVDVSAGGPTEVLFTTAQLPAGYVTILGFLDSDGNAATSGDNPDNGDPVTFPSDNEILVVEDADTEAEVVFSLLNP